MNIFSEHYKLNHFWKEKPFWCQPWTILLTGASLIIISWTLFQSKFITILISIVTSIWWLLFLLLVPIIYSRQKLEFEDLQIIKEE